MTLDLCSKSPLQKGMPTEMLEIIDILKGCKSQEDCLRMVYDILTKRFAGDRLKTVTHIASLFVKDISVLWTKKFLHCTNSNYILRHLLIASGHFVEKDIQLKWTFIRYLSPHQYVRVLLQGNRIDVDIRASAYGIPFGDHAHWFHWTLFRKEWKTLSS